MKNSHIISAALAGSAMAFLPLLCSPALAQESDPPALGAKENDGIQEIIVTAQRRDESLQKTSVVLDVVSSDEITRVGVNRPEDITRLVPGVSVTTSTPAPQIYIRGVGDFAATSLNNPAIAINVDGVYVPRAESLSIDLFDIERIEILKGPQGTLYGRNASGGALNVITRQPKLGEFGFNADVELGSLDSVVLNAGFNIPIGDTFAIRAAGKLVRQDGYTTADRGDARTEAFRIRALWEPSDDISVILNGNYGHVGGRGPGTVIINGPAGLNPYEDNTSPAGIAFVQSKVFAGPQPDLRPLVTSPNSADAFQDMEFWRLSAEIVANLGFADLTIIPAYSDSKISYNTYPFLQVSFGTAFGGFPARPDSSKATSLEVRLSNESERLKWVLGGYYYDEKQKSQFNVNAGLLQHTGRLSSVETRALAAFGQMTFSINSQLRVIGGLRYTSDRRALFDGATYYLNPSFLGLRPANPMLPPGPTNPLVPNIFSDPNPNATLLIETYSGRRTFENVSWKVGAEFDAGEDVLVFATASSGFKAGGFNQSRPLGAPAGSNDASFFRPEKLTSYDVGIKSKLLDNQLQLNVGAFYWDYKDQHVRRFAIGSAGNLDLVFENAQSARIYGANIDVIAKPWRNGTFNVNVEYSNAKYKSFIFDTAQLLPGSTGCIAAPKIPILIGPAGPVQSVDCSGKDLPRAPRWTGAVGYVHNFYLANGGEITAASDLSFMSARELTGDYISEARVGGYLLANASISYTDPSERFSVSAFVRNITDEKVYNGGSQPNYAPGLMIGSIGLPRTYGVRFGVDF